MYLTRFSDIGLRIMMYLAKEQRASPKVTISEISEQFNLPRNHVVKIASRLARNGWVDSTRGRTGGLMLGKGLDEIRLGQVIRVLENREELIQCDKLGCSLSLDCGLRSILRDALENFYEYLDRYTLADLVADGTGTALVMMHRRYLERLNVPVTA
jgi:Rrf2 family nitric oxide-sensitive transcriptional repressor